MIGDASPDATNHLPGPKEVVLLVVTVALFLIGFAIAPAPVQNGDYTVTITYTGIADPLEVTFPILINDTVDETQLLTASTSRNGYVLVVEYKTVYLGQVNQRMEFRAQLFEDGEQIEVSDIANFVGLIENDKRGIDITATSFDDKDIIFSFRVLKFSNLALGLLFAISFLWFTELVPLAASSLLIPLIIVITKADTATGALSQFANPIIFLFLAGFLLAEAMERSGLDKVVAVNMLARMPANAKVIMLAIMVLAAVFSMFMSNTAASLILITLTLQVFDKMDLEDDRFKRATIIGIAYAATTGGVGSLIGTTPNVIATELLKAFDPEYDINFAEWFYFGLPVVVILTPIIFFYLWYRYKPVVSKEKLENVRELSKQEIEEYTVDQMIVAIIFVLIVGFWMTTNIHGVSASIVAVGGAVALYFTGQVKEEDLNDINWNILLLFGGGLTLGTTIIRTGLADWIAMKLVLFNAFPPFIILLIIGIIALVLTAIASNTASAAILIPIVMPLAVILGLNPVVVAVYVAIVCSVDYALIYGTPPTTIAFSTKLYKVPEIFRIGIVLDIIGLIVTTVVAFLLYDAFAILI